MLIGERQLERLPGIRPGATLPRRLDAVGRRVLPGLTTVAAVVLLALPLGLPGQAELQQVVALASVFFWSVYRPLSMPSVAVFAIGLLIDLLGPRFPGVDILVLLAVHGSVLRLRETLWRRSFVAVWLVFGLVATVAFVCQWVLNSALGLTLQPAAPALLEFGLAVALYPLFAIMMIRAHVRVAAPERA